MWHPGIWDGRKRRRREEEGGKVPPARTKNGVAEVLFVEHTLSKEIILNEVSLGGSPTINFALQICRIPSLQQASCNTVEFDGG